MDACKRKQESGRRQHQCLHQQTSVRSSPCGSFMFAIGKATPVILFANVGGLRPSQPPRFLKAMDACKSKQESGRRHHRCLHHKTSIRSSTCGSFMFCTRGKLRGSFCLQMGGLRPLQPACFLKAMDAFKRKQESGRRQRLRPLQPACFLKAMDAFKRKQESGRRQHQCLHQQTSIRSSPCGSFMLALAGSEAGHFVCKCGMLCPPTPRFLKAIDA